MSTENVGPAPTLIALVLCDQVIDDRLTNKKSAVGIFNTVFVPGVPTTLNSLAVLASLTEISGRCTLDVRLVRDWDNGVVFTGPASIQAPDPLAVVDMVFTLQRVPISQIGQYAFEIVYNGEILGRRRFQVVIPNTERERQ